MTITVAPVAAALTGTAPDLEEITIAPGDEAHCVSCGCLPGCDCPCWCSYEEG